MKNHHRDIPQYTFRYENLRLKMNTSNLLKRLEQTIPQKTTLTVTKQIREREFSLSGITSKDGIRLVRLIITINFQQISVQK